MSTFWFCTVLLAATTACAFSWVLEPSLRKETKKPDIKQHAEFARWLVHANDWGVLSTISRHLDGAPYGHVVSYSDGPVDKSTGRLLFYLTSMDASTQDLQKDSRASLTICEAQLVEGCGTTDPEDPTCAKLTVSGTLGPVPEAGRREAERLLFSRHPDMRGWPAGHNFQVFELHIETMTLLNFYGGAHTITPDDYFKSDPAMLAFIS